MRRTRTIVHFSKAFRLKALEGETAPGRYAVVTEEEPISTALSEAWRRVSTQIRLPSLDHDTGMEQYTEIDPAELEAALRKDATA